MADNTERLVIEADVSSLGNAAKELDSFTESADDAGKAAEDVGKKTKTLQDVFGKVTDPIDETGKSLEGLEKNYKGLGISQGQYTNALRMLPAQMSDVASQLATGTSPFTILIQQGGQISDAFGGVSSTLKAGIGAVKDYATSLGELKSAFSDVKDMTDEAIVRFGRATTVFGGGMLAAVAALGYAASQSSDQFDRMAASVVFAGGAGFKSMDELSKAAQEVSSGAGASLSDVTDILIKLNDGGKASVDTMKTIATAVSAMGDAGIETDKAMGDFSKILKDPIKGMAELNSQYGFIDASMAKHVIALKKTEGSEAAAAEVVKLFAKTMEDRSDSVIAATDNIGQLWNNLKTTASNAFGEIGVTVRAWGNQVIDVFKVVGISIENLFTNITVLDGKIAGSIQDFISGIPGGDKLMAATGLDTWAEKTKKAGEDASKELEEQAKNYNKLVDKLTDKDAQANYEKEARSSGSVQANGTDQKSRDAVKKLTDESERKAKAEKVSVSLGDQLVEQYQAQSLALQAQIAVLKNRSAFDANQSQQAKDYQLLQANINILEKVAADENGRKLTSQEKSLLANKTAVLTAAKETAELGNQVQALQKQAQLADELAKSHIKIAAQVQAVTDNWGKSSQEQERALQLAERAAALRAQGATDDQIGADAADQQALWDAQDKSRMDWQRGLKDGLQQFANDATNFAQVAQQAVETAFNGMANAMTDFVTGGKADFKSFTVDILKMIIQIINKWLILKAIQGIGSAIGGSFGDFTSSLSTPAASAASSIAPVAASAGISMLSAAVSSPLARNAAVASSNAVSEPQIMSANSVSQAAATSGGVGGSSVGQVIVNVDNNGNASASSNGGAVGRAYGAVIADSVQAGIEKELKPGGLIFLANQSRS